MKSLLKKLDEAAPLFEKGGKFEKLWPVFELQDTFLFTGDNVTRTASHVRDATDMKRLMVTVVVALLPCMFFACWNTGYEAMLAIVNQEVSDAHVNELAWSCLGYARNGYDLDTDDLTVKEMWDTAQVFPNWLKRFPEPPDFLGVKRDYRPEIDAPVKAACSALVRSIPAEHKQGLKQQLKELGWTGFTLDGLTPNKTRRAQVANWLIFFREELNGVPLEELIRRKQQRAEEEEKEQVERPTGTAKQGVV